MRRSESALAYVERQYGDETVWLAQWNDNWKCFHFVGGHRHEHETFRQCLVRELGEELHVQEPDFRVAIQPRLNLEFERVSQSARVQTQYMMQIFDVWLSDYTIERLTPESDNRWLTLSEISSGLTTDGRAVSENMIHAIKGHHAVLPDGKDTHTVAALRRHFELQCQSSPEHPDVFAFLAMNPGSLPREIAEVVIADLIAAWGRGTPQPVQVYFKRLPSLAQDPMLKAQIIEVDYSLHQSAGDNTDLDSYLMQFPDLGADVRNRCSRSAEVPITPPETVIETPLIDVAVPLSAARRPRTAPPQASPSRIGRYAIKGILGTGKFGIVFEAFDELLQRTVAIKQPRPVHLTTEELETFRTEARHLAQLDHSAIVPVYDFGVTDDGLCYVVTRRINGTSLAEKLKSREFHWRESAELIAQVAEALHYAHCRQIVHRDLKPGNILLEESGRPYVVDFGLAINEDQQLSGARNGGTPAYMSPEQHRGEVRYLDGRSDIWSLGVVLYEMLTGRRPFVGASWRLIQDEISNRDPKPLRIFNADIPQNLELVCLRCLEKNKTHRFATALDVATELRRCLSPPTSSVQTVSPDPGSFRVVSTTIDEDDGFPIITCTVMNRSADPLVIVAVRTEVASFQSLRGQAISRELLPTSRADILLPAQLGSVVTFLRRPVIVAGQDAMSLELRLVCPDIAGACRIPGQVGGFKYRLVFVTDLSHEAATNELSIGRASK